ncbi:MAG: Ig-like domain-containing protein [Candidatus Krumholzibacteriota bacterium]|nr:Ig-like domain-containing protein [Candidatus Krumholzibacteriota bacterium]
MRARVGGVLVTDTAAVAFRAGPPSVAASGIGADRDTVTADGVEAAIIVVTARDGQGNSVSGAIVTLEASGTGNNVIQPTNPTASDGTAAGAIRSTVAEPKTMRARINGQLIDSTAVLLFISGQASTARSEVVSDRGTVTADGTDEATITVTVRDGDDNPVGGVAVTIEATGSGNGITQPVGSTGFDGVATGSIRSTVAETKTVRARIDGVLVADDETILFEAGPADPGVTTVVSAADTITADGVDAAPVIVTVLDARGNPVPGIVVTIEATGAGNTIVQPTGITGSDGVAAGAIRSTVAGMKTVGARLDGTPTLETAAVVCRAGDPASFIVTHDETGTAGVAENVTIDARDAFDNRVEWFDGEIFVYTDTDEAADNITWGLAGAAGTLANLGEDSASYDYAAADGGIATLSVTDEKAEAITILVRYGSVLSASAAPLVVGNAVADRIFLVSGDGQRAVVDDPVPDPLVAGVEDAFGNPVPGETVTFAVSRGDGGIDTDLSAPGTQTTAITGGDGEASCEYWRLGTTSGADSDEARASIASGGVTDVLYTATTDHDLLASVLLAPGTGNVTVNSRTVVTATLADRFGNLVVGENLTVFIKDSPADGGLSADDTNPNPTTELGPTIRSGSSDSTGTVTVSYDAPAAAGVQDVIDASHSYLPSSAIADVVYTTVASGATKLIVTDLSESESPAGTSFSFVVKAVDSNDNLDPANTSRVLIDAPAGGGFEFSLTDFGVPVTAVDLSGGQVALYGRGTAAGDWTIGFSDEAAVLSPTDVDVGILASATVDHYDVAATDSVTADEDIALSVAARDAYGNLVTTAGYDIDLAAVLAADSTTLADSLLTVRTGRLSGGIYAGVGIRYHQAAAIRIRVSGGPFPAVGYSGRIDVDNAPAWRMVDLGGDSTGVAAGDSVRMRTAVLDRYGNAVDGETVSFTVIQGGGGLAASQRVTRADGVSSVMLGTGTAAGLNRVRASILDGSPAELETNTWDVQTVPRGDVAYVLLSIDGDHFTAGENFSGTVSAYDANGNRITADDTTRLVPVSEAGLVGFFPDTLTLGGGEAAFDAVSTVVGTDRVAILSIAGDTLSSPSLGETLTFSSAPAYRISQVSGDTTGVVAGDDVILAARVRDEWGNPVGGEVVWFDVTSDLGGDPLLTDATGAPNDGVVATDAAGLAWVTLTTDTIAGENTVEALILDGDPAERERTAFSVSTAAGSISRFTIVPASYAPTAGQDFDVLVVAYDPNDNPAYGDDTTVVDLGADRFVSWSVNPVTLSDGSALVTASVDTAGSIVFTAAVQGSGLGASSSDPIEILPDLPDGPIGIVSVVPDTITANGISTSAITTDPVVDRFGNVVAPGTRITVETTGGTVDSDDIDPALPGYQRVTGESGRVSVFIQSSTTPGDVAVDFTSVEGSAAGTASLVFAPPPSCGYGGSVRPGFIVPGDTVAFRVAVSNASSTGLTIRAPSRISIADSVGNLYEAPLAADLYLDGYASDTLRFAARQVPPALLGGNYTPRVSVAGTDRHGSSYAIEFGAGSNAVAVSYVKIVGILPARNIVSRGDTVPVAVRLRNDGGSPIFVQTIQLSFRTGSYGSGGDWTPPLPDTLLQGEEGIYTYPVLVLPGSPLGADTIDASVIARTDGMEVRDTSADENRAVWLIQSAASIAYEPNSLEPRTVSKGQVQSFAVDLRNDAEAAVILDPDETVFSFSDGTAVFSAPLGAEDALPGGVTTTLRFSAAEIPAAMDTGLRIASVRLFGTENGGAFDTTIAIADPVDVVEPALLAYESGSLAPAVVSKRSAVSFSVGIANAGGATVDCDPDSTRIFFFDGAVFYVAFLDADRGTTIGAGGDTLWFESVTIPAAMSTGARNAVVRVVGEENGLPLAVDLDITDPVTVQEPSQLAIARIDMIPGDRVTADQGAPWAARVHVQNNGEAPVRLDDLALRLSVGVRDVTDEIVLTPADFTPGGETLAGGQTDSFAVVFADDPAGPMTVGTVVVDATVEGVDLNSGGTLIATTEFGGKGSYLVQTPADLVVRAIQPSVGSATALQTRDWRVDVVVENRGESDAALDLAAPRTALDPSFPDGFVIIVPDSLAGGGAVLGGETVDTLVFTIDRTGSAIGACGFGASIGGTETNSGRPIDVTVSPSAAVEIQSPAVLVVTALEASRDPVTIGQPGAWSIAMTVRNDGGSGVAVDFGDVDSTFVDLPGGTGFVIDHPDAFDGGGDRLDAGDSGTLTFPVTVTGDMPAGRRPVIGGAVATEKNSDRRVHVLLDEATTTDSVTFEYPPDPRYLPGSLAPLAASSGTEISMELTVWSDDPDHATVLLDRDATTVLFGDAEGDTFRAPLSTLSETVLPGGGETRLRFEGEQVLPELAHGRYGVLARLVGSQNGNPFFQEIAASPESLTVEDAPQLSILAVQTPASVTRGVQPLWPAFMVLHNTGEASVIVDTEAASLTFTVVGGGEVTGEYTVTPDPDLVVSGGDTLAGGQIDTLLFDVTATGSTTGTVLVNGYVSAIDINSGGTLSDNTLSGGWGVMAVQAPALPLVVSIRAGRETVTAGQTAPWEILVDVSNDGEAVLTLLPDSTTLYDPSFGVSAHPTPATFVGGKTTLAANEGGRLRFVVSSTPALPGGGDLELIARAAFLENNRNLLLDDRSDPGTRDTVRVQSPAALRLIAVSTAAPNAPRVDTGQRFPVLFEVENVGEASAADVDVSLRAAGLSTVDDSPVTVPFIAGGETRVDTFHVTASAVPGAELFNAAIEAAIDVNSGQGDLYVLQSAVDDTAAAFIQAPARVVVDAAVPSQPEVNAGQTVDWHVTLRISNEGAGTARFAVPSQGDVSFARAGVALGGYLVEPPGGFASGRPDLLLPGGDSDSLVYAISTTGNDTGTVDVRAGVRWTGENDPGAVYAIAERDTTVYVRKPSGVRIVSIVSDAPNGGTPPNTSIVNTGQIFGIVVTVENTGGDDLDSVDVSLVAENGARSTTRLVAGSPRIDSGGSGLFLFEVTAGDIPNLETLRAAIERAVSINTGERVDPIQAVESTETLQIQEPARLSVSAAIAAPAGAVDDTLSAGQTFVVSATVTNPPGSAEVDESGALALAIPAGVGRVDPAGEPLTRPFEPGTPVTWSLIAPAGISLDTLAVRISAVPVDRNANGPAVVDVAEARIVAATEEAAVIAGQALSVPEPAGAADRIVSSGQTFTVRGVVTPSSNTVDAWVELAVPAGYAVEESERRDIGDGSGAAVQVEWLVTAPSLPSPAASFALSAGGTDGNAGTTFTVAGVSMDVTTVEAARLDLAAAISGPPEALDGRVSIDLAFTVEATVSNLGEAGVDPTGATIEIVPPDGYVLDGAGETPQKAYTPGIPVTWGLRAPGSPTPPEFISVRFVDPVAIDENSGEPASVATASVPIPVQTEAASVSMLNVSALDTIPPYVVPRGARNVPVLRVVFDNTLSYTVGLDTLRVTAADADAEAHDRAARYVSRVALTARGETYVATATDDNPVSIPVAGTYTLEPGETDTVLVSVDVSAGAPTGELRLDIAGSRDVVFRIGGASGPRVGVVWEVDGGDIAGRFTSGPMSVMSDDFEEYAHNYPNPFMAGSEPTRISYFLMSDAAVRIAIYDLTGRLVWTREISAGEAGAIGAEGGAWCEVEWDGRNGAGEIVRNGIYLCRIEAGGQTATFKIAVAK